MKKINIVLIALSIHFLGFSQITEVIDSIKFQLLNENVDLALQIIDNELETDSLNAELYFYQGLSYRTANRVFESIASFNSAIQIDSLNADYHYYLGRSYLDMNSLYDSKLALEKTIDIDSTHLQAGNRLAKLYERDGNIEEALKIYYRHNLLDSSNYVYDKNIAKLYEALGFVNFAIGSYERAYRKENKDVDLVVKLSNAYYNYGMGGGDSLKIVYVIKAFDFLETAEKILSDNPEIYKAMGIWYFNEKYYEDCLKTFSLVDESRLDHSNYRILGVASYYRNEFNDAIKYLEKYIEKVDDNFQVFYFLGVAYRENMRYEESIGAFDRGLAIQTPNWNVYTQYNLEKADTYIAMKEFEQADIEYEYAYKYNPLNVAILYQKAYMHDKMMKDEKNALNFYNDFIAICKMKNVKQGSSLYSYKVYAMQRVNDITKDLFFSNDLPYEEELSKVRADHERRQSEIIEISKRQAGEKK